MTWATSSVLQDSESGALADVTVLEVGHSIATAVAGMLLADLGASVERVSTGEDSALTALDGGKRLTVLEAGAAIDLRQADVIVVHSDRVAESLRDAVTVQKAQQAKRRMIYCTISSFGHSSERSGAPGHGRSVEASCGLMRATHAHSGEEGRPIYTALPLASYGAGLLAAFGIQLALHGSGDGSGVAMVHTSEFAGGLLAQVLSAVYPLPTNDAPDTGASHRGIDPLQVLGPTIRCYESADGWFLLAAPSAESWARAAIALGSPELLVDEEFAGAPWDLPSAAARDRLVSKIETVTRSRPTADWLARLNAVGVTAGPVLAVEQFREFLEDAGIDDRLRGRPSGSAVGSGGVSFWRLAHATGSPPAAHEGRAPIGAAGGAESVLPLRGVKVVELATFAAGPYAAALLADYGAEVIKVEQPPSGDPYREQGYAFAVVNRNKASVLLDLRQAADFSRFSALVADADMLISNLRPRAAASLGVTFEQMTAVNPRLVYCNVSGWGTGTPQEDEPSVDPLFQAVSGLAYINGGNSGSLRLIPSGFLDNFTGVLGAVGALAALRNRGRAMRSQYVETSLLRSAILAELDVFLEPLGRPNLGPDPVGTGPLDRVYRTDDSWIYLSITDMRGWQHLAALLESVDGTDESLLTLQPNAPDRGAAAAQALSAVFGRETTAFWEALLQELPRGSGIAVGVRGLEELVTGSYASDGRDADGSDVAGEFFDVIRDRLWGPLVQVRSLVTVGDGTLRPADQPAPPLPER